VHRLSIFSKAITQPTFCQEDKVSLETTAKAMLVALMETMPDGGANG